MWPAFIGAISRPLGGSNLEISYLYSSILGLQKMACISETKAKNFFLESKFFFWKEFTGQVFIWDTPELSSPTKSALKLRLKMAKNHDFSWFYYVKWLKTWGARQIGFHHSDFKIFFFLRPWAWVLIFFRGQTLGTQNFILGTPGTVGYWVIYDQGKPWNKNTRISHHFCGKE